MNLREKAHGRWPAIIESVLGPEFTNTRKNRSCPVDGGGTDRYRFSDKFGTGSYFCACSDGSKDGFDLIQCARGCDFAGAAKMVEGVIGKADERKQPDGRLQRIGSKLVESKRSAYLFNRGLEVAPGLRFVESFGYYDEGQKVGEWPAMLAPLTRAGRVVGYQATYIENGKKAPVDIPRKTIGSDGNGAGVHLYPPAREMGVGEGVETCIAAKMLFGIPTHSALGTAYLADWQPPEPAEVIHIFADNDVNYAGHAAAYRLANRLYRRGYEVRLHFPPITGVDWNDALLALKSGKCKSDPRWLPMLREIEQEVAA